MSLLPNGSEFHPHSYPFQMADVSQVGEARRFALSMGAHLEFADVHQGRVSIVINELGNNLVKYAQGGKLILRTLRVGETSGLEILAVDSGPGLTPDLVMQDGFTTGSTPGTGLGAVRRQSDVFDIYSMREKGTVIVSQIFSKEITRETKAFFEVGAISIPVGEEPVSGDGWCVKTEGPGLEVLVVDGLGHGVFANKAATEAIDAFKTQSAKPLDQLLQIIHSRLKATRGGAIFLVKLKDQIFDFTGVGNIRCIILTNSSIKTLISQNGTAGVQMRTIKILSQAWEKEGYLVLHSDGITSRWDLSSYPGLLLRHPSLVAATIYRDNSRGTDDATVVVIRRAFE